MHPQLKCVWIRQKEALKFSKMLMNTQMHLNALMPLRRTLLNFGIKQPTPPCHQPIFILSSFVRTHHINRNLINRSSLQLHIPTQHEFASSIHNPDRLKSSSHLINSTMMAPFTTMETQSMMRTQSHSTTPTSLTH